MAFTLNQIILLVIALLVGLVLGLMMSGRGKYKRLWRDEQMAHRQTVRDRDARVAAAPAAVSDDGTGHDDLTRIRGVSVQDAAALHEAGYHRYDQIGGMSDEQQATLEARLGREPGTIAREEWRTQARLLGTGKVREHERRYLET
jgi:predicted flap endonuclease-1-like 5' DNA nuclease